MHLEARKLHLIEEMLKIKSEETLSEIEATIKRALRKTKKVSAHDFLGMLSQKDASLIDAAIEEACEQINPDDWK